MRSLSARLGEVSALASEPLRLALAAKPRE